MSTNSPERQSRDHIMPPAPTDESVVTPPYEHRDSVALERHADAEKKAKRRRRMKIGAAVAVGVTALPVAGTFYFMSKLSSAVEDTPTGPDSRPSASAPEVPGREATGIEVPEGSITLFSADEMMNDPGQIQANFGEAAGSIISERADGTTSATGGLEGLSAGYDSGSLEVFVARMTDRLEDYRTEQAGTEYADVDLYITGDVLSSQSTETGGIKVTSEFTFLVTDQQGQPVGHMTANTEKWMIDYEPQEVTLADGSSKDILAVADVTDMNKEIQD